MYVRHDCYQIGPVSWTSDGNDDPFEWSVCESLKLRINNNYVSDRNGILPYLLTKFQSTLTSLDLEFDGGIIKQFLDLEFPTNRIDTLTFQESCNSIQSDDKPRVMQLCENIIKKNNYSLRTLTVSFYRSQLPEFTVFLGKLDKCSLKKISLTFIGGLEESDAVYPTILENFYKVLGSFTFLRDLTIQDDHQASTSLNKCTLLLKHCIPHFVRLQRFSLSSNFGTFPQKWTLTEVKTINGYQALTDREVVTLGYLVGGECFREGPLEEITLDIKVSVEELVQVATDLKRRKNVLEEQKYITVNNYNKRMPALTLDEKQKLEKVGARLEYRII